MKKLFSVFLAVVLTLALFGCSKKTAGTADTTAPNEPGHETLSEIDESAGQSFEYFIDTASLDIDGDGVYEDCSITSGPTSGLHTIVITASVDGTVKYKNTFVIAVGEGSLEEKDGIAQFVHDGEYHRLYVEDNRIVIENLDPEYEGYWGGSEWNYNLK